MTHLLAPRRRYDYTIIVKRMPLHDHCIQQKSLKSLITPSIDKDLFEVC